MAQRETITSFLWRKVKKSPPLIIVTIHYSPFIKTSTEMVFCGIYSFHSV